MVYEVVFTRIRIRPIQIRAQIIWNEYELIQDTTLLYFFRSYGYEVVWTRIFIQVQYKYDLFYQIQPRIRTRICNDEKRIVIIIQMLYFFRLRTRMES